MKLLKCFSLSIAVALLLFTPAYAYSPPPATNIFLLRSILRPNPQIKIELPPKLIMTPQQLSFPQLGVVYTFNPNQGQFNLTSGGGLFPNHRVTTTSVNSSHGAAYIITITGFVLGELPILKDFRLTFAEPVSRNSVDQLKNYLASNSINSARLTGTACAGTNGSHICLDTTTKVVVPGKTFESHLRQTIPLKGIIVSGNSAAPGGTLANFIQTGNALAIGGGTFLSLDGGKTLSEYNSANSSIDWTNIGGELIDQFDSNKSYNKNVVAIYDNPNWNLNSRDKDTPSDTGRNTFSTPPEGRLWNVYVDPSKIQNWWRNDFYNIGQRKAAGTTFSGAGTISVRRTVTEGPMSTLIHGGVSCAPGTRFALITKGNIVFDTPTNGELKVDCGAYISLDGDIIFGNDGVVKKGTVNGIFIAKGNIVLPDPDKLTETFNINPDTNILKNPPVLLRELLTIVFGSSS